MPSNPCIMLSSRLCRMIYLVYSLNLRLNMECGTRVYGKCHSWNGEYGFLSTDFMDTKVFCHQHQIQNEDGLSVGEKVSFILRREKHGKYSADNVIREEGRSISTREDDEPKQVTDVKNAVEVIKSAASVRRAPVTKLSAHALDGIGMRGMGV